VRKGSDRVSRRKACNQVYWRKKGKPHCGAEGRWPCYRHCIKGNILGSTRVNSSRCKKTCKNMDYDQASSKLYSDFFSKLIRILSRVTVQLRAMMTLVAPFRHSNRKSRMIREPGHWRRRIKLRKTTSLHMRKLRRTMTFLKTTTLGMRMITSPTATRLHVRDEH
jgi:hypothetical protein